MGYYVQPEHNGHDPRIAPRDCIVCELDRLSRDGEGSPTDWDKLSTAFAEAGRLDLAHWTRQIAEALSADELAHEMARAQWGQPPRNFKVGEYR